MVRRLAAILRVAEGLDHSHRQRVTNMHATFQQHTAALHIDARGDAAEDLRDAGRSAELFEKEFRVRLYFRQAGARELERRKWPRSRFVRK
jgi:exopolyphosphatase/guanosine-5'-triphosphate,3'-diphosphate pyrophosphatase